MRLCLLALGADDEALNDGGGRGQLAQRRDRRLARAALRVRHRNASHASLLRNPEGLTEAVEQRRSGARAFLAVEVAKGVVLLLRPREQLLLRRPLRQQLAKHVGVNFPVNVGGVKGVCDVVSERREEFLKDLAVQMVREDQRPVNVQQPRPRTTQRPHVSKQRAQNQ